MGLFGQCPRFPCGQILAQSQQLATDLFAAIRLGGAPQPGVFGEQDEPQRVGVTDLLRRLTQLVQLFLTRGDPTRHGVLEHDRRLNAYAERARPRTQLPIGLGEDIRQVGLHHHTARHPGAGQGSERETLGVAESAGRLDGFFPFLLGAVDQTLTDERLDVEAGEVDACRLGQIERECCGAELLGSRGETGIEATCGGLGNGTDDRALGRVGFRDTVSRVETVPGDGGQHGGGRVEDLAESVGGPVVEHRAAGLVDRLQERRGEFGPLQRHRIVGPGSHDQVSGGEFGEGAGDHGVRVFGGSDQHLRIGEVVERRDQPSQVLGDRRDIDEPLGDQHPHGHTDPVVGLPWAGGLLGTVGAGRT